MFSNLLVLDGYHGPFVGRHEVQTLVDQKNHWFWAHRISQIYQLSSETHLTPSADLPYASGSRSPCAFTPLDDDDEGECGVEHGKYVASSDDADDAAHGTVAERSLRCLPVCIAPNGDTPSRSWCLMAAHPIHYEPCARVACFVV